MNQFTKITPIEHQFIVSWIPHIRCNYDCMYCPDDRHNDFSTLPDFETMCSYWQQVYEKTKHRNLPYSINFSGGEATINKNFIRVVEWLTDNYSDSVLKMHVTTNGSASLSYYFRLLEKITAISFSTHTEYMDDNFLDKIKALTIYAKANNKMAFVNVMQEYWATDKIKKIVEFCKTHNIPYAISKINYNLPGSRQWPIFNVNTQSDERRDLTLTQELLDLCDKEIDPLVNLEDEYYNIEVTSADGARQLTFGTKLRYLDLHHFRGWKCHAGLDRIFITPDSSVYSGECENDFMGKLDDNSFKLFDRPQLCKRETCTNNPSDIQTIKYAV